MGIMLVLAVSPLVGAPKDAGGYVKSDLPGLLEFADGRQVRTLEEWRKRRAEIRRLMEQTFMGSFPEKSPRLLEGRTVSETREDDGSLRRRVRLTFDTPNRISFEICLWIPKGEGPFPVVLTVPVHLAQHFRRDVRGLPR